MEIYQDLPIKRKNRKAAVIKDSISLLKGNPFDILYDLNDDIVNKVRKENCNDDFLPQYVNNNTEKMVKMVKKEMS